MSHEPQPLAELKRTLARGAMPTVPATDDDDDAETVATSNAPRLRKTVHKSTAMPSNLKRTLKYTIVDVRDPDGAVHSMPFANAHDMVQHMGWQLMRDLVPATAAPEDAPDEPEAIVAKKVRAQRVLAPVDEMEGVEELINTVRRDAPQPVETPAAPAGVSYWNEASAAMLRAALPHAIQGGITVDWAATLYLFLQVKITSEHRDRWEWTGHGIDHGALRKRWNDASRRRYFEAWRAVLPKLPEHEQVRAQLDELCALGIRNGEKIRARHGTHTG